jgi:hypothetical protein
VNLVQAARRRDVLSLLFSRFLLSLSPLSSPLVKNVSFFDDREAQKGHERIADQTVKIS